jgi:alkylation response protein AidB-like acyl-CoA dehydrogenase
MDFDLSKPQKLLKQSTREFLSRECPPSKVRQLMATETAHDNELWEAIVDQGWTALTIPETHDGLGLGPVELVLVAEEMGRACLPGPFLSTITASAVIERAGNETQLQRYLKPIAAGGSKATVAILEDNASWELDSLKLKASLEGDTFTITGKKLFVSDAEVSDLLICVTRNGDGLTLLPIERHAEGVTLHPMPAMDATRKLYETSFEKVRVAAADVLGADGNARSALTAALDVATVALCGEMVGGMQWILDTSVDYAKTRQQFGRVIGSFQAVQHQCADMLLLTESARSATYFAAWALSENDPMAHLSVSMAKAYCSDAFREVANRGVQIHGGIGFTWEHDLQLYYKRSKSSETMFGDATLHRERIARMVVDAVDSKTLSS